jgi:subtilisin family serine protease
MRHLRSTPFALCLLICPWLHGGSIDPEVLEALQKDRTVSVIVVLDDVAAANGVRANVSQLQQRVLDTIHGSFAVTQRWRTIAGFAGLADAVAVDSLVANPSVRHIGVDVGGGGSLAQSIPLIGAHLVQTSGYLGRGVTVAVLDTGAATVHPDLQAAIVDQHCFCRNSDGSGCCPNGTTEQDGAGSAEDDHGHGTNVSGIIASRGRIGAAGVAPEAKLVVVKVMDRSSRFSSSSQVISGLDWVASTHPEVRVINMSLGTSARFAGECDHLATFVRAFALIIDSLRSRGTLVFASTANTASATQIEAPACIRNAVAVGAVYDGNVGSVTFDGCSDTVTSADRIACFSNSSHALDLLAPGARITSTGRGGGTSTFSGTSQAAPHVAGTAALLLEASSSLTSDQIETALKLTGRWLTDSRNGLSFPRLDSYGAASSVVRQPIRRRRAIRH